MGLKHIVLVPSLYGKRYYSVHNWRIVTTLRELYRIPHERYCERMHICLANLEVNKGLAYRIAARRGKLVLTVEMPYLPEPVNIMLYIRGIKWKVLFKAEYCVGSRTPRVVHNELGLELPDVLKAISNRRFIPILKSDAEVIHRLFRGDNAINSIQMFDRFYRNGRFRFKRGTLNRSEKGL